MSEFRADLHCHTTCSDGSLTPKEIIMLAKNEGLKALSITDHDTFEAYTTVIPFAQEQEIELITGIEFSADLEGSSVHILGYGFNLHDEGIKKFCLQHQNRRTERNLAILKKLKIYNIPVSEQELADCVMDQGEGKHHTVGRPHIAKAMLKKGYVTSVQEAFKLYLAEGKQCYAEGQVFSVKETIAVIHQAKGLAVIAHPQLIRDDILLNKLLKLPFDGLEAYYGVFFANQIEKWVKVAEDRHLIVTGGSDFHGDIRPNVQLGCSFLDEENFKKFKAAINQRNS